MDDTDEDHYEVPEEIEEVIDALLTLIKDRDTIVRYVFLPSLPLKMLLSARSSLIDVGKG